MASDKVPRCANCGTVDEYASYDHRATHGDRVYYCSEACKLEATESEFENRTRGIDHVYDPDNPESGY
jgi:hypothetical protein